VSPSDITEFALRDAFAHGEKQRIGTLVQHQAKYLPCILAGQQGLALLQGKADRLFHHQVQAGLKHCLANLRMIEGRCCHQYGIAQAAGDHFPVVLEMGSVQLLRDVAGLARAQRSNRTISNSPAANIVDMLPTYIAQPGDAQSDRIIATHATLDMYGGHLPHTCQTRCADANCWPVKWSGQFKDSKPHCQENRSTHAYLLCR
jgi:hypothetical protein